jgi:hypothetical protein
MAHLNNNVTRGEKYYISKVIFSPISNFRNHFFRPQNIVMDDAGRDSLMTSIERTGVITSGDVAGSGIIGLDHTADRITLASDWGSVKHAVAIVIKRQIIVNSKVMRENSIILTGWTDDLPSSNGLAPGALLHINNYTEKVGNNIAASYDLSGVSTGESIGSIERETASTASIISSTRVAVDAMRTNRNTIMTGHDNSYKNTKRADVGNDMEGIIASVMTSISTEEEANTIMPSPNATSLDKLLVKLSHVSDTGTKKSITWDAITKLCELVTKVEIYDSSTPVTIGTGFTGSMESEDHNLIGIQNSLAFKLLQVTSSMISLYQLAILKVRITWHASGDTSRGDSMVVIPTLSRTIDNEELPPMRMTAVAAKIKSAVMNIIALDGMETFDVNIDGGFATPLGIALSVDGGQVTPFVISNMMSSTFNGSLTQASIVDDFVGSLAEAKSDAMDYNNRLTDIGSYEPMLPDIITEVESDFGYSHAASTTSYSEPTTFGESTFDFSDNSDDSVNYGQTQNSGINF